MGNAYIDMLNRVCIQNFKQIKRPYKNAHHMMYMLQKKYSDVLFLLFYFLAFTLSMKKL